MVSPDGYEDAVYRRLLGGFSPDGNEELVRNAVVVTIARTSATEPTYFIGDRPVSADTLLTELKSAGEKDSGTKLVLRADRDASWEAVARAMQFAKKANIASVRAFTKPAP